MVRFVGIALTEQEAALRPKSSISTDIQSISSLSAGKLFVGIEGGEDEKFALKMEFDGNSVKIKSHETAMGSTLENVTSGRYKPYAIDLPMRFVTVQETPHEIFQCYIVHEFNLVRGGIGFLANNIYLRCKGNLLEFFYLFNIQNSHARSLHPDNKIQGRRIRGDFVKLSVACFLNNRLLDNICCNAIRCR